MILFDTRIFQSQEVEDAAQPDGRDRLSGRGLYLGFGVEGDAQAREVEHRQVVGAVADCHRLGDVDLLELAQQAQQFGLAAPVDHLADIAPRELALLDLQLVGIYVVESVFL